MKCACGQTFEFESDRDLKIKIQMHNKICFHGPEGPDFARQPRKAVTPKEAQCMITEKREFC